MAKLTDGFRHFRKTLNQITLHSLHRHHALRHEYHSLVKELSVVEISMSLKQFDISSLKGLSLSYLPTPPKVALGILESLQTKTNTLLGASGV